MYYIVHARTSRKEGTLEDVVYDLDSIFGQLIDQEFALGLLTTLFERSGLSKRTLALRSGVSTSAVSSIFNEQREPKITNYAKLMKVITDEIIGSKERTGNE